VDPNKKSGTSVIKSAPPKETARITVKPSLPAATARPAGNLPTVKPAEGAVPLVAKAGVATAAVAAIKGAEAKPKAAAAKSPSTVKYEEEPASTLLTTVAAGVLAALTWGTAAILGYYSLLAQ
jgi:hypothetical protein